MNNENNSILENQNLDGGGELIEDTGNYTSDYDMLVGELEKKRNEINKIF